MPVYEPGATISIVLDCDAQSEAPPSFSVVALSARESLALTSELDSLMTSGQSAVEQLGQLETILEKHVKGWSGLSQEYAEGKLLDVLGVSDMWRLGYAIARQIGTREKKV